jgi:hypothetical protein
VLPWRIGDPTASSRRDEEAASSRGRRKQQAAEGRSTDGLFGLELGGREEGVRCMQAAGKRA